MENTKMTRNLFSKIGMGFLLILTVANFISTGFILKNVRSFDISNLEDISLKSAVIISVVKYLGFSLFVGICYYTIIRVCSKITNSLTKTTKGVAKCFIFISLATLCGSILISTRQKIFTPMLLNKITNIAIIDGVIFFVLLVLFSIGIMLGNKNKVVEE